MRYHEIMHQVPVAETHPWTVTVPLHPSLWSQFAKFVGSAPADFLMLTKLQPEPDGWVAYVGCATEAARDRLEQTWG